MGRGGRRRSGESKRRPIGKLGRRGRDRRGKRQAGLRKLTGSQRAAKYRRWMASPERIKDTGRPVMARRSFWEWLAAWWRG